MQYKKQINAPAISALIILFTMMMFIATHGSATAQVGDVSARINQIRASAGLSTVVPHAFLQQAAQAHALDMITYANWSHVGTDGSRVKDRVLRTGYALDGWTSENWVSATNSATALTWWMNSPIHRDNILGPHWQEFGVGSAFDPVSGRTIYVAVFSTGHNANVTVNTPVAAPAAPASPLIADRAVYPTNRASTSRSSSLTIQSGDTLFGLAEQYGIPWGDLAAANGWTEETLLQLNQPFIIPTNGQNLSATAQTIESKSYIVQPEDTLISIARDLQVEWQAIAHVNNLQNADMLQIGQNLLIPTSLRPFTESSFETNNSASPDLHTTQSGETIFSLAAQYDLDWKTLLQINGLTESSILQIGQEIRLQR